LKDITLQLDWLLRYQERILANLKQELPPEAEVTKLTFEGPRVAILAKKPLVLLEKSDLMKQLARKYHLRFSIRADPSVRLEKRHAEEIIRNSAKNAGIVNIWFEDLTGNVYIEAEKPGAVIGKGGIIRKQIIEKTGWIPVILRAPPMSSPIITYVRKLYELSSDERQRFLKETGRRIHRPYIFQKNSVRVAILGGGREVGGNAFLIQTKESNILVDCGLRVSSSDPFPLLDLPEFVLEELDAVIITHAHLDHTGLVPFLYKHGYRGPVFCTEPTKFLATLLLRDYIKIAEASAAISPFSYADIDRMLVRTITIPYHEVNDIAPDVRLTFYNAGHILGSAIVHIHIAEGLYNIVIASDIRYSQTYTLQPAETVFPRVECLIVESTYGSPRDVHPPRKQDEAKLIQIIKNTINNNGKVIIPVLAVGRAQEILVTLYRYMYEKKLLPEIDVYIAGMIEHVNAIYMTFPEWLDSRLYRRILQGYNPFKAPAFHYIHDESEIEEICESRAPAIIVATSGMLEGGPVIEFLKHIGGDKNNALIFVSYQVPGTPGYAVLHGAKAITVFEAGRPRQYPIDLQVFMLRGFSGHSPFPELRKFVHSIQPRPKRIIVVHGDQQRAQTFAKILAGDGFITCAPINGEVIRLL